MYNTRIQTNLWFPNVDEGRIPGAEMVLFIVRVDGRSPCLDPIVVKSLAATSRSRTCGLRQCHHVKQQATKPNLLRWHLGAILQQLLLHQAVNSCEWPN